MEKDKKANNASTLQELAGFLTVLSGNRKESRPLLNKKEGTPESLIYHLDKRFGNKAA